MASFFAALGHCPHLVSLTSDRCISRNTRGPSAGDDSHTGYCKDDANSDCHAGYSMGAKEFSALPQDLVGDVASLGDRNMWVWAPYFLLWPRSCHR